MDDRLRTERDTGRKKGTRSIESFDDGRQTAARPFETTGLMRRRGRDRRTREAVITVDR